MGDLLPSGCSVIDELLKGGLQPGLITTIFGPSSAGKSTVCMIAALTFAKNKKVIYIDSEGNASRERLNQLAGSNTKLMDNILVLKPTNFKEQKDIFNRLKDMLDSRIGIIIVDTISMLYRVELADNELPSLNQELGKQLSYLLEIARKKNIPCIVVGQVYQDFENEGNVKIVGGEIIKYSSKVIIELKMDNNNNRTAILRKHPSMPESRIEFKITQKGLERVRKGLIL